MDGHAVVAAYYDLWKVEQSFRMAKSDLKARPIFHRTRDSIKKMVRTLRRIHTVIIDVDGHELTARAPLDDDAQAIIEGLGARH